MNCNVSALLGLAMLGGTFSTLSVSQNQYNKLISLLSPDLVKKYKDITNMRRDHYIQGIIIGLVLTYFILNKFPIANSFHRMMLSFGITGLTSVLYYCLMPKKDYMLNHLKTQEEIKAWLKIYKKMKRRYLLGLIIGLLSAIPISNSLCIS
jgi:hypothetical protein